ncbi:MAG TPA: DUF2127 domain-containing protein [Gemmatimonadaceae bacterium]|nr:DUF2127 domain-containing protein [Gemmatimonadaceae bacterium]
MSAPVFAEAEPVPRSSFINVLAWVFIVLSGLGTLVSALQNVMIRTMPFERFDETMGDSTAAALIPASARFMFEHFRLLAFIAFVFMLAQFVASVGLLRRRNWARQMFMGLLICDIAYVFSGVFLQQSMMSSVTETIRTAAAADTLSLNIDDLTTGFAIARIVAFVFAFAVASVFGWIVYKLASPRIRAEFTPST